MIVFVVLLSVLCANSQATTCSELTQRTCAKTLHVSSSCRQDLCVCQPGYQLTRTSCIESLPLDLNVNVFFGKTEAADLLASGSGEVLSGGSFILRCMPYLYEESPTYVWRKDQTLITNYNKFRYDINNVSAIHAGNYTCQMKMDSYGYVSAISAPKTITVIAGKTNFSVRAQVVGMKARAMNNSVLKLECANIPAGLPLTIEWHVGGQLVPSDTAVYTLTLTITPETLSKSVTCTVVNTAATSAISNPNSEAVMAPALLTADISSVQIVEHRSSGLMAEVGTAFTLHCAVTDTDLATANVIFTWSRNASKIMGKTGAEYQELASDVKIDDTGIYKCHGQAGSNPVKDSVGTEIKVVDKVIGRVEILTEPFYPLTDGYIKLTCNPQTRNVTEVQYTWIKDKKIMFRQTDRVLQIDRVNASDAGNYQCSASVDLVRKLSSVITLPQPKTLANLALNSPPISDKPANQEYGIGNIYMLTCDKSHMSPGASFVWKEGNNVITDQTESSYTLQAKEGMTTYQCQISFNNITSLYSPPLTVDGKHVIKVVAELDGVVLSAETSSTSMEPVTGSRIKLSCKVTKAAGSNNPVTYVWMKNGTLLSKAAEYEFIASNATNDTYMCRSVVGSEMLSSEAVTFTASDTLKVPNVTVENTDFFVNNQPAYSEGGTYKIFCSTTSHTSDVVYTWLKNDQVIYGTTSRTYTIYKARQGANGDSGVYKCKAKHGNQEVTSSTSVAITIEEAGRPCTFSIPDCSSGGPGYAEVCYNSRCECADGYRKDGNKCSNATRMGLSWMMALLLLVVARL